MEVNDVWYEPLCVRPGAWWNMIARKGEVAPRPCDHLDGYIPGILIAGF
jgi:hypothetical protein